MLKAQKEEEKFVTSAIMEGMVSVRAVIDSAKTSENPRKIEKILYDGAKEKSKMRELAYLRAKGKEMGFDVVKTTADEIDSLTVGSSHGGIIAVCGKRSYPDISENDIKPRGFYVMLEGIEDPYNLGYALRSVYAAGADGLLLSERNWLSAAGVVARASAGASELIPIYVGDPIGMINKFKSAGYKIYATDKTDDSVSVYDEDARFPLLLLVGGERRGLSRPVLDAADKTLCLDYGRSFPAALSAASAASIISFEIFRKNRGEK